MTNKDIYNYNDLDALYLSPKHISFNMDDYGDDDRGMVTYYVSDSIIVTLLGNTHFKINSTGRVYSHGALVSSFNKYNRKDMNWIYVQRLDSQTFKVIINGMYRIFNLKLITDEEEIEKILIENLI